MNTKSAQFLHEVLSLMGFMPHLIAIKDGWVLYTFSAGGDKTPVPHIIDFKQAREPRYHTESESVVRRLYERAYSTHMERKSIGYASPYHGYPENTLSVLGSMYPNFERRGKVVNPEDI